MHSRGVNFQIREDCHTKQLTAEGGQGGAQSGTFWNDQNQADVEGKVLVSEDEQLS